MDEFRVLTVCRANYCRSPMAQVQLQHAADQLLGADAWLVASAGVDVPFDANMHPLARTVLESRGIRPPDHRTHQIDSDDIRAADLILTATRRQRSAVVTRVPAALGRTFTLLQFARLADQVDRLDAADPRSAGLALIEAARRARGTREPADPGHDDLDDPMGGPRSGFEMCATTVQDAVDRLLRPLR